MPTDWFNMLQKLGFSFLQFSLNPRFCHTISLSGQEGKKICPARKKKSLTKEAGKDSFLLLQICLPGLPVLRFEVIFLVNIWPLKGLLCSFPNISCSSNFIWSCTQLGLQQKFAVFLCILIIYWNDHLFSATGEVNEKSPKVKIFQSKIVNAVPIQITL